MATQDKYSPRTYGNRTNNTWKETVCDANGANCRTETYYVTVQDPGDGGPLGLSGNLAGKTTIYKRNDSFFGWLTGQAGDVIVGEIPATGPNKGKLVAPPNVWSGMPLDNTIKHFSKPDNLNRVKNQAILTTQKGMMADKDVYGVDVEPVTTDPKVAETKSRKLLDTGTAMPDDESINTPTPEPPPKPTPENAPSAAKPVPTRNNYGTHIYPLGIGASDQDVLKIDMVEYKAAGLGSSSKDQKSWGPAGREKPGSGDRNILGSVILPIPGGIKDDNKVDWGEDSLDAAAQAAANVAISAIAGGKDDVGGAIKSEFGAHKFSKGNKNELIDGMSAAFTAAAVGKDFKSIMGRAKGQILNPNMELLFRAPTLRPFDFSFLLAPRSKEESQAVAKIIRFFKQGMAVRRTESNLFLKSPNTFQLTYKHRGEEGSDHPYLNKFKECALKACSVNYTPDQAYSTYIDGAMTAYTMTLSFQELTPVYNDDYEEDETTAASESVPAAIGY